jgi:TolB-like protein/DNA-binding winged helix-turn-helix (wHTH) protein
MPIPSTSVPPARFGPFEVDFRAGDLLKNGRRIRLQDQPLQVLAMLLEHPGDVVTRDEFRQSLWPNDTFVDFDHGLNNAINRLRDALNDSAEAPRFIETLPRRGYRFISLVEGGPIPDSLVAREKSLGPSGNDQPGSVTTVRALLPWWRSRWAALGAAALVLSSLIGFVVNVWKGRFSGSAHAMRIEAIAVLPLENLTGDSSQEYFADGITDALTTELAQIGSLRVISRTTAIQYKGTKKTLREIGRELNVDAVVEGSVQRSGDRLSISAQLVEAKTDRHLWARSYETAFGDILSLESRVANDVTREMQLRLTPQERSRLSRTRAALPEAYEYYLRAKPHLWLDGREDNEAAIELLERAVAIDTNFAQAYAALAMVYNARWVALEPQQQQWEEKAFGAAEKALALDPDLADGYMARGRMLWTLPNHYPHERAILEYRRALVLDPNLAEAHHELSSIYNHIGMLEKGRQEIEKAVALDPLNTGTRFRVGINLLYQAKYEEALSAMRDSERYFPRLWAFQTAFALFQLGRKEEASARIEEYLQKHPKEPDTGGLLASMQALFAAAESRNSRAQEKIQRAIRIGQGYQHFHHAAYAIASAYSLMNKPEAAMAWLERAAAEGFPCYPLFEKDPNLNNLRQNPRFIEFMARQKKQWEYFKATL